MIGGDAFRETALVLALATALGALAQRLRQPLLIAFLAVGVMVGPSGWGLIRQHEQIALLAQIGISLLLFVVGLRLDLTLIRTLGPVALATGLGQVVFTSVFGFLIVLGMGLRPVPGLYVAVALTFSSTIIVVKLLSDKKEIDSLHGRIAVGFLIVQDLVAILAMIGLTALGGGREAGRSFWDQAPAIVGKGIGLLGAVALAARYVLPGLLKRLARTQELLALFAVAWAVLLAALGDLLGFSKEVGAFLAGVSLASTTYREAIGARLVTLRDFLLLFFFIDLGVRLELNTLGLQATRVVVLSLFVLIGNPLIVMAIMGYMGYRRRTGFLAGLTVAQISEFSLILGAAGMSLGHLDSREMGLVTMVGVVTICASTYMILFSGPLYDRLAPWLRVFERRRPYRETEMAVDATPARVDVILLGLGSYGGSIARLLLQRRQAVVGVDFNPESLEAWRGQGLPVLYGDAGDPELLDLLPIERARWVVETTRDGLLSRTLLRLLLARRLPCRVAVTARDQAEADALAAAGADLVLRPFVDAAEEAADALTEAMRLVPKRAGWPLALLEMRLPSGSPLAGQSIGDLALRAETGASILAVSRAGHVRFDPGPDFRVFPGDRLVLLGTAASLRQAAEYVERRAAPDAGHGPEEAEFDLAEIAVADGSACVGQTLAQLQFRQRHGVTVVGIRRSSDRIEMPRADARLDGGDRLMVVGHRANIERLKQQGSL